VDKVQKGLRVTWVRVVRLIGSGDLAHYVYVGTDDNRIVIDPIRLDSGPIMPTYLTRWAGYWHFGTPAEQVLEARKGGWTDINAR